MIADLEIKIQCNEHTMQQCYTRIYNSNSDHDLLIFIVMLLSSKRLEINENFIIYDGALTLYMYLRTPHLHLHCERKYVCKWCTSLIRHVMLIGNRHKRGA